MDVLNSITPTRSIDIHGMHGRQENGIFNTTTDEVTIVLPSRYGMCWVSKVTENCENDHNKGPGINDHNQDEIASREEDLSVAIEWLRQEIILLKRQDKTLTRKFLDLRSKIHQLQQHDLSNSFSGRTSQTRKMETGSCESIDEPWEGPQTLSDTAYLLDTETHITFRPRSVSLLTPRENDSSNNMF